MNPKVDDFLSNAKKWQAEMEKLRLILLDCQLTEEFKWNSPCYTFKQKNVVIIGEFKDYCVLNFFKGVLLSDTNTILVKPGENSQSARFAKFTNINQIIELETVLKAYIYEAIEVEKAGLKVTFDKNTELEFPEELLTKFSQYLAFKTAFEALTPGRQRAYNMFFSEPKQSATKVSRIEKYTQRILNGKGMNDCVCGLSKRLPNCDGSHKNGKN